MYVHCWHYLIASSLFYYINSHCYKIATSHKKIAPMLPTQYIHTFFTRINPWKFGEKKIWIGKVIQLLLKVATQIEYKKDTVSTNVE